MLKTSSVFKVIILGLSALGINQAYAQQAFDPGGAISPEAIEYNYMLDQVRAKGNKGDDLKTYTKQCNDSGICRYERSSAGSSRSVVYQTPYGQQTVIYPEGVDQLH